MSEFITDTPQDIDNYSEEQIIALADTFGKSAKPAARAKFIKNIYSEVFKYDLSKDLFYMLIDEPKEQFIIAPAGGGKTTNISAKVTSFKLYRRSEFTEDGKLIGPRILSLVYNKENVADVLEKHRFFVNKINSLGIDNIYLDNTMNCRTLHSFAYQMIIKEKDFSALLGITNFETLDVTKTEQMISDIVPVLCEAFEEPIPKNFSPGAILSLNNYIVETFSNIDDLAESNLVLDTGLSLTVLKGVLKSYAKQKQRIRRLDHTDTISLLYKLLTEFPEARTRIQNFYDVITADEIQDFTPIFMKILKLIVGPHASLICIGDDDQAIYGFRGADNNNALNFKELFPDSKVHLLRTNRRCPSNILNLASNVVSLNKNRFKKEMRAVKGPGNVEFIGYNTREGQYKSIVMKCKEIGNFNDTVVAYRNSSSSYVLSVYLHHMGVPFQINKGYGPFDYPLFNAIIDIMKYAKKPTSRRHMLNLYKVLPITRDELYQAMGYNFKERQFYEGDIDTPVRFADLVFNQRKFSQAKFKNAYDLVMALPMLMHKKPSQDFMPIVIDNIVQNYWAYLADVSNFDDVVNRVCIKHVYKMFQTSALYLDVEASILDYRRKYKESKYGVALSTFHSLKGLEFDDVIVCDLAENIFPNFSAIDFRNYDDATKTSLKESENRLFYVTITRAKKNLYFFYDKQDPSYYISFLKQESVIESKRAISYDDKVIGAQLKPSEVYVKLDTEKEDNITASNIVSPSPVEEIKVIKLSDDVENPAVIKESEVKDDVEPVEVFDLGTGIKNSVRKKIMNRVFKK